MNEFSKQRKVTITIGIGQTKNDTRLTEEQLTNALNSVGMLVIDAGYPGYQLHNHAGGWLHGTKIIVEQCISVVIVTETLDLNCTRKTLKELAAKLCDLFEQTCVAVEIADVNFALVTGEEKAA